MSKKVKFKEYTKDGKLLYTDGIEVWEQIDLIGGVNNNEEEGIADIKHTDNDAEFTDRV